MTGTKLEIFKVAVDLFSRNGYASVGIRDIAEAAGMKSSNIYNHFKNKDALLETMFTLYRNRHMECYPSLEEVLAKVPTTRPRKLLSEMRASFGKDDELFAKIGLIAMEERDRDPRAESLMFEIYSSQPRRYLCAVLSKMIAMEIIEPLNIDAFVSIVTSFNFFSAARIGGKYIMSSSEWTAGYELMLNMIREKDQKFEPAKSCDTMGRMPN